MEETIDESIAVRTEQAKALMDEYFEEVDVAHKNLLAAIEGFRRDADLAKQSDSPIKVHIETKRIFIPPVLTDASVFPGMAEVLIRMTTAFVGSIELGFGWQKTEESRHKAWAELHLIHENLVLVSAAGRILYGMLEATSRNFHEFNGNNDEDHAVANIVFNDEALDVCIATTRAIIEHAVRLDIDIMSDLEKVRTDDVRAIV